MTDTPKKILTFQEEEFLQAAVEGNAPKLLALLKAGVNVDVTDDEDFGAVHQVAYLGHTAALKVLLEYHPKLDIVTVTGMTPLGLSAMHRNEREGVLLLEAGAGANFREGNGSLVMDTAAHQGMLELVKSLLKHGASLEPSKPGEKSPVMLAAMGGSLAVFKLLEEKGADIHYTDKDGLNALGASVWKPEIFNYLLPKISDAELRKEAPRLLSSTTYANNPDIFHKLLARGIKAGDFPVEGFPLLHVAAVFNLPASAGELLAQGVPISQLNRDQQTARAIAVERKSDGVVAAIDAKQHQLNVEDIVATVQKGVGRDTEAPAKASFKRKSPLKH